MPTDRGEEGDLRSASSFHGNSARKSVFMVYGLTYIRSFFIVVVFLLDFTTHCMS